MIKYDLHPSVTAFTTTRRLGRDYSLLCPALAIPADRFYRPHQVHKTDIRVMTEDTFRPTLSDKGMTDESYDAVIYNVRNTCIGISTADCIPVLAYDPVHHVAAAIHAGWRGTVERIVEKTLQRMTEVFGTNTQELLCAIGPGISLESFEVGDEVYQAFADAGFDMAVIAKRYTKWHLDIKECNRQQLLTCGVKPYNIIVSDIDTMTDQRFYSARREGAKTGRLLSGIVLR